MVIKWTFYILIFVIPSFYLLSSLIGSQKIDKKNKIKNYIFVFFIVMLLLPHKLFYLNTEKVSYISVYDGNTDKSIEVNKRENIEYILNQLNKSKSRISSLAMFRTGSSFKVSIYYGKKLKREFVLNSVDNIRDMGFFWKVQNEGIDYAFILKLYEEEYGTYKQ